MNRKDLEIFNHMPVLFWVKDGDGRYLWGNSTINERAGEEVAGKTDRELIWAANADRLREHDRAVLESGKPSSLQDYAAKFSTGDTTLSVCKFVAEFEGERCIFGLSFTIEDPPES